MINDAEAGRGEAGRAPRGRQDEGVTSDASWTGTCRSSGLAVMGLGAGLVVAAAGVVVVVAAGLPVIGAILLVLAAVVAIAAWWTARLRVEVTNAAFVVAWGPFARPRKRIAWDSVAAVSALQVEPRQWGGWGYRWVPWAHASAAVVRRGPGIRLDLENGRTFVVTVEDAVTGAKAAAAARRAALRPTP